MSITAEFSSYIFHRFRTDLSTISTLRLEIKSNSSGFNSILPFGRKIVENVPVACLPMIGRIPIYSRKVSTNRNPSPIYFDLSPPKIDRTSPAYFRGGCGNWNSNFKNSCFSNKPYKHQVGDSSTSGVVASPAAAAMWLDSSAYRPDIFRLVTDWIVDTGSGNDLV